VNATDLSFTDEDFTAPLARVRAFGRVYEGRVVRITGKRLRVKYRAGNGRVHESWFQKLPPNTYPGHGYASILEKEKP